MLQNKLFVQEIKFMRYFFILSREVSSFFLGDEDAQACWRQEQPCMSIDLNFFVQKDWKKLWFTDNNIVHHKEVDW